MNVDIKSEKHYLVHRQTGLVLDSETIDELTRYIRNRALLNAGSVSEWIPVRDCETIETPEVYRLICSNTLTSRGER